MRAVIRPAHNLRLDTTLPGDKSIAHRAVLLSALAEGESVIFNFPESDDCRTTLRCLEQLGIRIRREDHNRIVIEGRGKYGFQEPAQPLDCGNSGTTARLLAGILAGQRFSCVLTGDDSLRRRPMKRIADPLRLMGASVELSPEDTLPMRIEGRPLNGIRYTLPVPSAQVKSCLIFAGMVARSSTTIYEPVPTRDHTERMLRGLDIREENSVRTIAIHADTHSIPARYNIPGDLSTASFLIAAGLMLPGSNVILRKISVNPIRTAFLDILQQAGAGIRLTNQTDDIPEPYADIHVTPLSGPLKKMVIPPDIVPRIIDELPILAVLGTQCESGLSVTHACELRVKECDRISALVNNLRAMSVPCDETEDGFRLHPARLHGADIHSYHDHRIAMAFTVAAMAADSPSAIHAAECVSVSFPDFFSLLEIKDFF